LLLVGVVAHWEGVVQVDSVQELLLPLFLELLIQLPLVLVVLEEPLAHRWLG
jgi:hypothetical protein